METRRLGSSDIELSIVGMGGLVIARRPQEEADEEVARAIDRGVTYFDVAPEYADAQELLGPALERYRDRVTLACKTEQRLRAAAAEELADSLAKLRTDHFDIYLMHGFMNPDEARAALGPGGAIETFLDARDRGQIRLMGFSAHDEEAALIAIDSGHFDMMLMPLNFVAWTNGGFGRRSLAAAGDRGMGVTAIKAIARTGRPKPELKKYRCWYTPEDDPESAEELFRWTLSLPGVAATVPPSDPRLYNMLVEFGRRYRPITEAETADLAERYAETVPIFPSDD